jgi:hypothetical protein
MYQASAVIEVIPARVNPELAVARQLRSGDP